MAKTKMVIKFKNNHTKDFNVTTKNKEYLIYTAGEKQNSDTIVYAGIKNGTEIVEITKDSEREMIVNIIENFNKGV